MGSIFIIHRPQENNKEKQADEDSFLAVSQSHSSRLEQADFSLLLLGTIYETQPVL